MMKKLQAREPNKKITNKEGNLLKNEEKKSSDKR